MRVQKALMLLSCVVCVLLLAGCGFHMRRSAPLPPAMARNVYLQVNGDPAFARSLAQALRAGDVNVLYSPAPGAATLAVPVVKYSSRLLYSEGIRRVGEYVVEMQVEFKLTGADGKTVVPTQTLRRSHEFAIDRTEFTAISSETTAIETSLVREMTAAVMRRLHARAAARAASVPAPARSG